MESLGCQARACKRAVQASGVGALEFELVHLETMPALTSCA